MAERGHDWLGPAGLVTGLVAWALGSWVLPLVLKPWLDAGMMLPNLTRLWLEHSHWLLALVAASIAVDVVASRPGAGPARAPALRLARAAIAVLGMLALASLIFAAALPTMLIADTVG